MAIISNDDVQVHLPVDKLNLGELTDSLTDVFLDVERIVRGTLAGTFSAATLAVWSTPDDTPEYIRSIGGRLAAALIYRLRLAQDFPDDTEYAQQKYNEAMQMLEWVRTGQVVLEEVTEEIDTGGHLSTGHYSVSDEPVFSMDMEF